MEKEIIIAIDTFIILLHARSSLNSRHGIHSWSDSRKNAQRCETGKLVDREGKITPENVIVLINYKHHQHPKDCITRKESPRVCLLRHMLMIFFSYNLKSFDREFGH